MNSKSIFRTLIGLGLAAMMLGLVSCKKDEDKTKLYLSGSVKITSYPLYAALGEEARVHLSGITHPDGKALGLCVKLPWKGTTDTLYRADSNPLPTPMDLDVTLIFPDSLGTFTVNFYVYPIDSDKYYPSTGSFFTTTVDDTFSIPEIAVDLDDPRLVVDDRDQMIYNYVTIGSNNWITRNICTHIDKEGEGSRKIGCAYYRSEAVNRIFGRFYTWEEAMVACPEGWHLPSVEDWDELPSDVGKLMIDAHFNGDKMWEFWPAIRISGESGLNLIPTGYCNSAAREQFEGMLEYASFWTSNRNGENTSQAAYKYIYMKENELKTGYANINSLAMPVRCVEDKYILF